MVFLKKVVFLKGGLNCLKEQVMEQLESDGYVDIMMSGVLPSCLEMDDIMSIMGSHMGQNTRVQDTIIFQSSFVMKCLSSLKKEVSQLAFSEEQPEKKETKKGKKTKLTCVLPIRDMVTHLVKNKDLPSDIIDDSAFQDSFYALMTPLINQEYDRVREEKTSSNKSISTNFVFEL